MGIPIYVVLAAIFAIGAISLVTARVSRSPHLQRWARVIATASAAASAGAAIWYAFALVSGQLYSPRWHFWATAIMILVGWFGLSASWRAVTSRKWLTAILIVVTVPVIPLVQWTAPSVAAAAAAARVYDFGEGLSRVIRPAESDGLLYLAQVPRLGPLDAPFVVLGYFDYTSSASRTTQRALLDLRRRFGSQIAVLPVLYPLDPDCNPKVTSDMVGAGSNSCVYAKLSLAVWLADPAAFESFHEELIAAPAPSQFLTTEQARAKAVQLVGAETLDRALADPRIGQVLADAIAAKPRHLSSGLASEVVEGVIDLRPCVMWKGLSADDPAMITVGELNSEGLLREFEEFTGAIPQSGENVAGSTGDAMLPASLMQLLERIPGHGGDQ